MSERHKVKITTASIQVSRRDEKGTMYSVSIECEPEHLENSLTFEDIDEIRDELDRQLIDAFGSNERTVGRSHVSTEPREV